MSFIEANTTYYFTNLKGGTCVDLSGGDNTSSTSLSSTSPWDLTRDAPASHRLRLPPGPEPNGAHPLASSACSLTHARTQWTFENAGGDTFFIKSSGSGQYLSAAGDQPSDGQKAVAAGAPYYAWRVQDEAGVDGGVRWVLRVAASLVCVLLIACASSFLLLSLLGVVLSVWHAWDDRDGVGRGVGSCPRATPAIASTCLTMGIRSPVPRSCCGVAGKAKTRSGRCKRLSKGLS